jgi:hypothetical protein
MLAFYAVVLYDFAAEQPGDLSLSPGEKITILDDTDESGWWKGRKADGSEGVFPSNFVQRS